MNSPVHRTLWPVNHREFPPNSMWHIESIHREGKRLEEEELLLLAEVQVPGNEEGGKRREGRDGLLVGLLVQLHHGAPTAWAQARGGFIALSHQTPHPVHLGRQRGTGVIQQLCNITNRSATERRWEKHYR